MFDLDLLDGKKRRKRTPGKRPPKCSPEGAPQTLKKRGGWPATFEVKGPPVLPPGYHQDGPPQEKK